MTPAQLRIKTWREDPVTFVREHFHVEPDAWQAEVLRAFGDPQQRRLAMRAAKGPGKTAVLAWCIWNFLACYGLKGSHPKGAATSISYDNLRDNLWSELSKWQQRSEFLRQTFTWTKERIFANDHPETWFFSSRAWSKSSDDQQQANTLAGLHADFLLFVLDESGGIPDAVMAAAEGGLATGIWGKILQAGNPTHLEGPLYRACTRERQLWSIFTITGDPDDPQRSPRISVQWAREQIEKYGADDPWVLVNVFGQFPPSSLNALLSPDEVEAAMRRTVREDAITFAQKRIGVDVARFGDDRTVLFPRQGLMAFLPTILRGARTDVVAARVAQGKAKWSSELELIDDSGGYGGGVIDALQLGGITAYPVHGSGRATDARYFNLRSETWFLLAAWVKGGGCLPLLPELTKELVTPTYTFVKGKFRLEEKDQIKQRLGCSPDLADALALTFALPDQPGGQAPRWMTERGTQTVHDYDPLAGARLAEALA